MRHFFARRFFLAALMALPAPVPAQQDGVFELFRVTWTRGVATALDRYGTLSNGAKSPALLVGLADQLLWTGKHEAATAVLTRAEEEAPQSAEIAFQQGRAHLQRGETADAIRAFRRGLTVADSDTALSDSARASLTRRLANRVWFLERADGLASRTGAYRTSDGRLLFFKFDPYINTFPSLMHAGDGTTHFLYPGEGERLEWRGADGRRVGSLRFEGESGNAGLMVLDTPEGSMRASGLGIRQETLRYSVGCADIEATLFKPASNGAVPAVVLTHGAGLSSRYNLVHEAVAFAASGTAALVYDKPGLGRSTGGNWLLLSIPEQAHYVIAAVEELRRRADTGPVGAWGFSQGAWAAPLAARRSDAIAFVIMASGAAVSPQEQSLQATVRRLQTAGAPDSQIREVVEYTRTLWSLVNAGEGLEAFADLHARADSAPWGSSVQRMRMDFELTWWRENEVDAGTTLEALAIPVLALFAEHDAAVPPHENVPLMARHLAAARSSDYTIAVLPGANHQFMIGDNYQPLYFATMTRWVAERFSGAVR